ncbi:ARM repeat-containing protein [Macrolepiota fuliginosa MF-IS2]|uniref:ARM repeat-containing protein n=1 Tax=Macrolepiota fuliginosa MF-IS2 TaxID=1400762 RepID=A0A9P5XEX1_9AGAR|nr:ARM repeat-containing protein [Macrolepiota fuliginosa MF-IS2]
MILSGVVLIPLPFPLAAVRAIDDFSQVQYPEGIISPNPQLNSNVENGKFRYDREFLMQFMPLCKEKPITLPPLDAIGLEPIDQNSLAMSCASHGRHRQPSGTSAHIGLGFSAPSVFVNSTGLNPFAGGGGMSNFNVMRGSKLTGKERSPLSLEGPAGILSNRTRSQRGKRHGGEVSTQRAAAVHAAPLANPKPVVPLKVTEDSLGREAAQLGAGSRKLAGREVGDLLNELTTERFDSISDRIIERVNKSEGERDGRTLILVIRLVFERATDGVGWSKICARLCRKMMDRINNNVRNDRIRNSKGKPMAGGQLFQNYLLKKYREDFERGWLSGGATTAPVTTKATEGGATKAANEKNEGGGEEVVLYSTEYYAAQKARQQDLGLIRFVGELFKLQVIAKHIVLYECAKKLLVKANNPDEKKIEGLCQLLTTVGSLLDTRNARARMDAYFQRMRELAKSPKVSPRMQSMLQDVIELREQEWIVGNEFVEAPSMIYQTHETAVDLSNLVIAEAPIMLGPGSESATGSKAGDGREPLVQTSSSSKISFMPRNAEPGAKEIMSVHPQFGRKKPPPRAKRIEQTEMQQQEWE